MGDAEIPIWTSGARLVARRDGQPWACDLTVTAPLRARMGLPGLLELPAGRYIGELRAGPVVSSQFEFEVIADA